MLPYTCHLLHTWLMAQGQGTVEASITKHLPAIYGRESHFRATPFRLGRISGRHVVVAAVAQACRNRREEGLLYLQPPSLFCLFLSPPPLHLPLTALPLTSTQGPHS